MNDMDLIKLVTKDTDLSKEKITRYNWDVSVGVGSVPYYVVEIAGYVHTVGYHNGIRQLNDLWAYRRDKEMTFENLIPWDSYCSENIVRWGIRYEPQHYLTHRHGDGMVVHSTLITITRNDKPFYQQCYSIEEAQMAIRKFESHPLELHAIDYDKNMIGRKIWWQDQPAIITKWIDGQACIIIEPDGKSHFDIPQSHKGDPIMEEAYDEPDTKICILSESINWFRN